MQVAAWQLESLIEGKIPSTQHDGRPWLDGTAPDDVGGDLGFRGMVMYVKGDWAEYAATMGLPTWQNQFHSCPFCPITKDALDHATPAMLDHDGMMWEDKEEGSYEHACGLCERIVDVDSDELRDNISDLLDVDPKGKGRVLKADVLGTVLKAGDRLEPSRELLRPCEFHEWATPFKACFWRRHSDVNGRTTDQAHHRSPIFNDRIGTSPLRSLAVDSLHTVYLGGMMRWVSAALLRILASNPWGLPLNKRVKRLEAEMFSFFLVSTCRMSEGSGV